MLLVADTKLYFINGQISYIFAVGMEKLSIGLVLLRLTRGVLTLRKARTIIITATVIMCAAAAAVGIVAAKQCRPKEDPSEVPKNCVSSRNLATAALGLSALDMAVNFLFAVSKSPASAIPVHAGRFGRSILMFAYSQTLPIWMLKGSGVSTSVRISLLVLLGLGFA